MRRVFDTGADVDHEVQLGKWRRCLEDEPAARRAVELGTKALGDDRPAVAADRAALAGLFERLDKSEEAEQLLARSHQGPGRNRWSAARRRGSSPQQSGCSLSEAGIGGRSREAVPTS